MGVVALGLVIARSVSDEAIHLSARWIAASPSAPCNDDENKRALRFRNAPALFAISPQSIEAEFFHLAVFAVDAANCAGDGAIDHRFRLDDLAAEFHAGEQRAGGDARGADDDVA